MDAFEEALKLGSNAPADPVGAAVDGFRQTGVVTNKQAADILMDSKAVAALQAQGLDLKNATTASARRKAIKNAVAALAQKQAEVDNSQATVESRRLTAEDIDDYMRVGDRRHVRDTKQRILDNGDSPILTKTEEIATFIRNAFRRKIQKTVKGYGRVNNRLANAVKTATDGKVNIDDYYLELDADKIAHMSDHVVKDADVRNIPLSEEQLEQLPRYIDTYDDLIDVIRRKDGSVRLMLGKKINGHSIILETVSKGRKSLHPVTAYQIDSADYMKFYKTRAIDRSSTSRSANTDTVDISRPTIAPANNSISESGGNVNIKSAETESVGAAPEGFTGKQGYYDQLTDENSQPDRPGDVRPMEVLKKDRYGRRVTEFSANAYGAEITSDQMADQIQELIDEGALGFDTRSNPESMQKAADDIREKGYTKVRRDITANVANGRLQDGDIEKAMLLYAAYANRKDQAAQDNAAELMVDLATMANMSGRNLQLFRMLRKLTPEGQRMSIQKTIDRYVEQLNKKSRNEYRGEQKLQKHPA